MLRFRIPAFILLLAFSLPLYAYATEAANNNSVSAKRVTAEIVAVDNVKASDNRFYYRFKLKYPDKTVSYGYVPVRKLELWYADLNNIVGSVLEFTPANAPTPELEKIGCSVVNPKVIY